MKILYIIPARAGSKGLPGKNTKSLLGKPLIVYSIEFALKHLKHGDEICISTNDEKIINIAKEMGIDVPFIRPEELSNDTANSYNVITHAINYYEKQRKFFDFVLLLQPTSPLRNDEDFENLIHNYEVDIDMVVSVKFTKENPYSTLFEENELGYLSKSKPGDFFRRQECPPVYAFNGSMYLMKISSLKKTNIQGFQKIKKIVMPEERSVDIDTMADWVVVEYYLKEASLK